MVGAGGQQPPGGQEHGGAGGWGSDCSHGRGYGQGGDSNGDNCDNGHSRTYLIHGGHTTPNYTSSTMTGGLQTAFMGGKCCMCLATKIC